MVTCRTTARRKPRVDMDWQDKLLNKFAFIVFKCLEVKLGELRRRMRRAGGDA